MSTIVNARDVLLQGTSPRLLPALLPGNLTVATANVIGYPDFYSSVRSVEIGITNQVFVQTTIAGVTPASIVLTATLHNILGAVTWSVISGTATYATGTNTLTIANSGMTSVAVVIQASVTSGGVTYTDRMTVVKVVEGSPTVTGFLTNETSAVAALAAGEVLSYGYSGGTFKMFQGAVDVTGTAVSYSVVSSTSVSVSIATTGVYKIDRLVADSGSFVVRAVYSGTTIDKAYSVTKSKSTFNGDSGVRGTVNIARSITGSVWSDAEANLAISNAGYGTPLTRDIVTLYNTSISYSESKFYNTSAWTSLDAYINGNLLVTGTVVADKIATNTLTADKMVAGTITAASGIIADAAITNAKIGGDIQSTNYVAGTSGWRLDRAGNVYANNGEFRGNLSGANITGAIGSFSGNLSGANGTFDGTLTATNAVITDNIIANGISQVDIFGVQAGTDNILFGVNKASKVQVLCLAWAVYQDGSGGGNASPSVLRLYKSDGTLINSETVGNSSVVVNQTTDSVLISMSVELPIGSYYLNVASPGGPSPKWGTRKTTVLKVMK